MFYGTIEEHRSERAVIIYMRLKARSVGNPAELGELGKPAELGIRRKVGQPGKVGGLVELGGPP